MLSKHKQYLGTENTLSSWKWHSVTEEDIWGKYWNFQGVWKEIEWEKICFVLVFLLSNESFGSDINFHYSRGLSASVNEVQSTAQGNAYFGSPYSKQECWLLGERQWHSLAIAMWKLHAPVLINFFNTMHAVIACCCNSRDLQFQAREKICRM